MSSKVSTSSGKKTSGIPNTCHRLLEERPELHLNLDSKDLVKAVVSDRTAHGVPILPQPTDIREVVPVRLTAFGISIVAAIRRDDLYFLGFQSMEERWFACKLADTPAEESKDVKGKGKCKYDEFQRPFVEGAIMVHFFGSCSSLLELKLNSFKFSMGGFKAGIKILGNIKSTDVLDDKNTLILHSFAHVCLFIPECCRFLITGDMFIALANDPYRELAFVRFIQELRHWSKYSYSAQHDSDAEAAEKAPRLRVMKFELT